MDACKGQLFDLKMLYIVSEKFKTKKKVTY